MADDVTDVGQDVFDDSGAGTTDTTEDKSIGAGEDTVKGAPADDSVDESPGTDDAGDKASGTPPEGQEALEEVVDTKTGKKLIPEHRFKAALKKVTDELESKNAELAKYTATPVPDKETDPEGHSLHVRMTASADVMREMKSDYQDVINHYAKLAESNPLLNQAVADHPLPAKLAYDIAKRDLEIKEIDETRKSGDWEKFQTWKKAQTTETVDKQTTLNETVKRGLKTVPNLNRSTNASPNRNVRKNSNGDNDDDLFAGAL